MTTSTSLSGRSIPPRPPAKGSFPLDHLGECKAFAEIYEKCIHANNKQASRCREEARKYLKCRMEAGLMAQDSLQNLGLGAEKDRVDRGESVDASPPNADKQDAFVSGMRLAKRRKERHVDKPPATDGGTPDAG